MLVCPSLLDQGACGNFGQAATAGRGGGSLAGGEGSVLGTIVGALIMTVIKAGCDQMGLSNWVQEIVTGVIIILAVTLDRLRHRRGG